MGNKHFKGYKEVPEIDASCKGCDLQSDNAMCSKGIAIYCSENNCIFVKSEIEFNDPKRKNCWETISDFFEEWNCDNTHNGDDMIAVAQDAIVADNKYLAFQLEDLMNIEPTEFKKEVQQLLKQFQ